MELLKKVLLSGLLTIAFICPGRSQGFLHAEGEKIINGKGENIQLRGIGLGGWMLQEGYMLKINKEGQQHLISSRIQELIGPKQTQEFYDSWLNSFTRKADIDSLKKWGFNSVRLPMHYNLYTLAADQEPIAGKDTWLEKGFALTDSLLSWCKANHMYLILDLHAAPGGQGNDLNIADRDSSKPSLWDSEANQKKTIALWKKLAERYVNEPWIGGYDLINEPNWGFEKPAEDPHGLKEQKNAPLRKLMVEITAAIRSVDTRHLIIIEGNGWGNNYNGIMPAWDQNMALSFHKYWNYNDQAAIAHIVKMRTQYNIPAWLGETGENSNVWFTDAIRLFTKNNIGWSWWPLKKIGINNPAEIVSNPDYDLLVNFLNGKGEKPEAAVAYRGLMKLAAASRIENTVIHRDVTDAMIRQPFSSQTLPFKNNTVRNNTVISAVDYDLGISGAAYSDKDSADYHVATGKTTPGNSGHQYRNDGVDIIKDPNHADHYIIDHIESGEWLQYTIDVEHSGTYTLNLALSAEQTGGSMSITLNGKLAAKDITILSTGGLTNFKQTAIKDLKLEKGKQVLRVYASTGGFNFKSMQFIK